VAAALPIVIPTLLASESPIIQDAHLPSIVTIHYTKYQDLHIGLRFTSDGNHDQLTRLAAPPAHHPFALFSATSSIVPPGASDIKTRQFIAYSMPSQDSPSSITRPSLNHNPLSNLSSSSRNLHSPSSTPPSHAQKTAGPKAHRPHVVGAHRQHGRNPSYGKNLNKLHRPTSSQDVTAVDAGVTNTKGHQRKKSGPSTPSTSPRGHFKRNSSNVSLNRNGSHVSLKKNHSATSLKRNTSSTEVKKSGLHRSTAPPEDPRNGGELRRTGFDIGDSDNEDDWTEENSSQSPNTTRGSSRVATRATSQDQLRHPEPSLHREHDHHSPREAILRNQDQPATSTRLDHPPDADIITSRLLHWPRGAKAPPKMSTVSATGIPSFNHNSNSRSYTFVSHGNLPSAPSTLVNSPSPARRETGPSSIEGGVSRFINGTTPDDVNASSSSPLSTNFPLRTRTPPTPSSQRHKSPSTRKEPPSRTQQKLWLQRAATESVSSPAPINVSPSVDPLAITRGGSSRGSRGRGGNEARAIKKLYERANSELGVVRRYRNPVIDSLARIDIMHSGPDGRRKIDSNREGSKPTQNNTVDKAMGLSQSLKDREREGSGRVRFQRSEGDLARSRDDIAIGRAEASDDEEDNGGAEEILLRRLWGSREAGVPSVD
jgi:hypothetical protein